MSARRKHHEEHEEHENHERWLVTYADMITLLMVLFIVLFAIGQVDLKKFAAFRSGINHTQAGKGSPILTGGSGVLSDGNAVVPTEFDIQVAVEEKQAREQAKAKEGETFTAAEQTIQDTLKAHGLDGKVTFRVEGRGLVVSVLTDKVLFESGRADIRPEGAKILDGLAPALLALDHDIMIEGHTDDRPISGIYPSNWELSTARAASVLRYLMNVHGLPAKHLSAAGYADQRPIGPNDTEDGRSANRRVEIVVLSNVTSDDTSSSSETPAPPAEEAPHTETAAPNAPTTDPAHKEGN